MKLLIVDDEESITTFLSRSLKKSPYEVHTANSGADALSLMQENPPDILITDIRMPNMDGVELAKETLHLYPDVAVIAITGYSDIDTAVEIMKYGAIDFLQKPVNIDIMHKAIESAADKWRLRRDLRLANEYAAIKRIQSFFMRLTNIKRPKKN